MKIAILNDTHCGARLSAPWMIKHQARFYEEVFWPYIDRYKIKTIVHLGDYYENRVYGASLEAQEANRDHFLLPMKERQIQMHIIVGNHDAFYKNTNTINSLDLLLKAVPDAYIYSYARPSTIRLGGELVCLIPWINSENTDHVISELRKTNAKICMGHFEFQGFPMQKGGIPMPEGLSHKAVAKFDMVLSGHYHTKSQKDNVRYLGTQFELDWSDCGDPKHFHVLDLSNGSIEEVENPHTLFEKVIVTQENLETVKNRKYQELFVQLSRDENVSDEDYDLVFDKIKSEAYSVTNNDRMVTVEDADITFDDITDTPNAINAYIDEALPDVDDEEKNIYKSAMEGLYKRAVAL